MTRKGIKKIKAEIRKRYIETDINITDLSKDYDFARPTIGVWVKDLKAGRDKLLSLAVKFPNIAKEWHPTKNGDKTPFDYKYASNKKVWWLCNTARFGIQHEYYKPIEKRTLRGSGCKICKNKGGLSPQLDNSLFATFNHLVSEIHAKNEIEQQNIALNTTYFESNNELEWNCNNGYEHTYSMQPRIRTLGFECGVCRGRQITDENNLEAMRPEIARQWHSTKNGNKKPSDYHWKLQNHRFWWICSFGHPWKATIHHRTQRNQGCSKCSIQTSKIEIRVFTELSAIFKNVLHRNKIEKIEADIILQDLKTVIEIDGWYYHKNRLEKDIEKNRIFKSKGYNVIRIRDQRRSRHGKRLKLISKNDIEYFHRDRDNDKIIINRLISKLIELLPLSPKLVKSCLGYIKSPLYRNEKMYYKFIANMAKPTPGNSLTHKRPEILKFWHKEKNRELTPQDVFPKASLEIWWQCQEINYHEWKQSPETFRSCIYCNKIQAIHPLDSIKYTHPNLAKQFHPTKNEGISVEEVHVGQNTPKIWWKCENGPDHEWETSPVDRHKKNKNGENYITKCGFCLNKRLSVTNTLEAKNSKVASLWNYEKNFPLKPSDVIYSDDKKYYFTCENGHEVKKSLRDIKAKQFGNGSLACGKCSGRYATEENNLQKLFPHIADMLVTENINPEEIAPFSGINYDWKCKECDECFNKKVSAFTTSQICPKCNHDYKSVVNKND